MATAPVYSKDRGDGRVDRVYVMYHGTSASNAASILKEGGFRPSRRGMLGAGVYASTDPAKATNPARRIRTSGLRAG